MKRYTLLYTLALGTVSFMALQGCKKENGIDNDTVIKKPYGLYVASMEGELLNTTDGENYKTLFPVDNYPTRSLVYSDSGIYFLKGNLHASVNNGRNFNVTYSNVPLTVSPWQTVMLSALDQDRVYVASTNGRGITFTEDEGKNWFDDPLWDNGVIGGSISTFTQLKNNAIYAYSNANDSLYRKDNKTDSWSVVNQTNPIAAGPLRLNYLGHFDNTLLMVDFTGSNVYYSNTSNPGSVTWNTYSGLPARALYAANAPFDEVLLVGTDSMGVYRLQSGTFVPANNGLETGTTVYGIVGKDNVYKNGARKRFIYLATDKGLFRSEDLGQNWIMVKDGSYIGVY